MPHGKIICLAGPTGSGKSGIAARLGQTIGGVVINADSRQVYADFSLITAQPGADERRLCPHLLYGFMDSQEIMSAGLYVRLVRPCVEAVLAQGETPILVGGTGLYFRAFLRGLAEIPPVDKAIHETWQERCAVLGSAVLHRELVALDPEYAAKIHPHDRQRVTRALEVWEATGKPLSLWHRDQLQERKFDAVFLGVDLSLEELTPLLEKRIDRMLEQGAMEEAGRALQRCADPRAPGWSGIGCAELHQAVTGRLSLEEARVLWIKNTRAYAKRQITWFRSEKDILWRRPEEIVISGWTD